MFDCNLILGRDRKRELFLRSPLLPAAGALGHAPPEGALWRRDLLGAFITPALTGERDAPATAPRVVRTVAGALISPAAGPPLRAALRRHSRDWRRWDLPVIVALAPSTADEAGRMAEVLTGYDWVQGIELDPVAGMPAEELGDCVRAAREVAAVPCLARVPFEGFLEAAAAAQDAGADAIVVAAPPMGRVRDDAGCWASGELHSPALFPLYAERVREVSAIVATPIIARGEIGSPHDALSLLAAGALALQLASILWVRPGIIAEVYAALEAEMAARSVSRWDDLPAMLQQAGHSSAG